MSLTLDASPQSGPSQEAVFTAVPLAEQDRVKRVIALMDRFFSPDADLRDELDKDMHPIQADRRRGEIVKYKLGSGAVVRSVEIPLDHYEEAVPGTHDALALSIRAYPNGELETEKHRFAWLILPNGQRINAGRQPEQELDHGDFRFLEVLSEKMQTVEA